MSNGEQARDLLPKIVRHRTIRSMPTRYADYDRFARIYNRHWGRQNDRRLELLDAHVLGLLPGAARILDLCCGTGQLAQVLTRKGHDVLGIDGSERMLEFVTVQP